MHASASNDDGPESQISYICVYKWPRNNSCHLFASLCVFFVGEGGDGCSISNLFVFNAKSGTSISKHALIDGQEEGRLISSWFFSFSFLVDRDCK